jgi:hypothetical protein
MEEGIYILDGEGNLVENQNGFGKSHGETPGNIRVAYEKIGNYIISTVQIEPDYKLSVIGEPHVYETMVYLEDADYGKEKNVDIADCDGLYKRYYTRDEATHGHKKVVELVTNKISHHG